MSQHFSFYHLLSNAIKQYVLNNVLEVERFDHLISDLAHKSQNLSLDKSCSSQLTTLYSHCFLARLSVIVISKSVTRHVDNLQRRLCTVQHGFFSGPAQHYGEEDDLRDSKSCKGG